MSETLPNSYFAGIAENYDRMQPIMAGPAYKAGLDFLVGLIPFEESEAFTCVELGCGTATVLTRLLERYPKATGVGVDCEVEMLQVAARKLAPFGARAQLHTADVATCDLPACDLLVSSFMFHHVPPQDLERLLRRIRQALRPGGHFFLLDRVEPDWTEGIRALSYRLFREAMERAVATGEVTQEEIEARRALKREMKAAGKDVEYWRPTQVLLDAMRAAGFAEVGQAWRMFAETLLVGIRGIGDAR